jgi:low affinity Fe/Cu permease
MDKETFELIQLFYENSWNKLMFIITIMFVIVGIIFPVIIQYIQNRVLKRDQDKLEGIIEERIRNIESKIRLEMLEIVNQKINDEIQKTTNLLMKKYAQNEGGVLMVQANSWATELAEEKLIGYLKALLLFLDADDDLHIGRTINNILPILKTLDIKKIKNLQEIKEIISKTTERLEAVNSTGKYTDFLKPLKKFS